MAGGCMSGKQVVPLLAAVTSSTGTKREALAPRVYRGKPGHMSVCPQRHTLPTWLESSRHMGEAPAQRLQLFTTLPRISAPRRPAQKNGGSLRITPSAPAGDLPILPCRMPFSWASHLCGEKGSCWDQPQACLH